MRWTLMVAMVAALAGCGQPAETTTRAGSNFAVDRLFTVDDCTVYRFRDAGSYRYFTNCAGTASWHESCGKNCSREMIIPGGGR